MLDRVKGVYQVNKEDVGFEAMVSTYYYRALPSKWMASWHPMCLNWKVIPTFFCLSKSLFAMIILTIFADICLKQIPCQLLGSYQSSFPLYRFKGFVMCHDSQLMSFFDRKT